MNKPILTALSALTGAVIGAGTVGKVTRDDVKREKALADKHLALFCLMNQWVKVKQEGKNLASYFERKGYKKIAIYGMSYAGETLVDELRDSGISIAYGIDKNAKSIYSELEVLTMEHELKPVDAVVVTAITFFDDIEEKLSEKVDFPIISLEDVLYEV